MSSLIPIMALIYYLHINAAGDRPLPFVPMLILEATFLILALLFYGLRITVDDRAVRLRYGIGLIRFTIPLTDIAQTNLVRSRWYYGIGIRLIPGGMLYNAHSLNAVELKIKDKKRVIWIGTPEQEALKQAIDRAIGETEKNATPITT